MFAAEVVDGCAICGREYESRMTSDGAAPMKPTRTAMAQSTRRQTDQAGILFDAARID